MFITTYSHSHKTKDSKVSNSLFSLFPRGFAFLIHHGSVLVRITRTPEVIMTYHILGRAQKAASALTM